MTNAGPWEAVARQGPVVRRAAAADVGALVGVLVRAFDDDPVARYLFSGDRVRARGLRRFFGIQLRSMVAGAGEVWTTSGTAGAAMWTRPGVPRQPSWREVLRLSPVLMEIVLGGRPGGGLQLLGDVEQARPSQPHWYLATIGTDPPRQGHGIGSALLRPVLALVDEQQMPAYLESSKWRNVPFYARHGFEVTGEIRSRDGSVSLWPMWRSPRPPGA